MTTLEDKTHTAHRQYRTLKILLVTILPLQERFQGAHFFFVSKTETPSFADPAIENVSALLTVSKYRPHHPAWHTRLQTSRQLLMKQSESHHLRASWKTWLLADKSKRVVVGCTRFER